MEVHISNIPKQATEDGLRKFFDPLAKKILKGPYYVQKLSNKNYGFLIFQSRTDAELFLRIYEKKTNLTIPQSRPQAQLMFMGYEVRVHKSTRNPDKYLVKVLQKEHKDRVAQKAKIEKVTNKGSRSGSNPIAFSCHAISCGVWGSDHGGDSFVSEWTSSCTNGKVKFGKTCMVLTMEPSCKIEFRYRTIDHIVSETLPDPSVTITLFEAPRFYSREELDIVQLLAGLNRKTPSGPSQSRLPFINESHQSVAGTCLVYRLHIQIHDNHIDKMTENLRELRKTQDMPSIMLMNTQVEYPRSGYKHSDQWQRLQYALSTSQSTLPFVLKYQLQSLAQNGYLRPHQVLDLIPVIGLMLKRSTVPVCVAAVRRLSNEIQRPGPGRQPEFETLAEYLLDREKAPDEHFYARQVSDSNNLASTHRVLITPTGNYLYGPDTDANNRVLRQYNDYHEYFLRVRFCDEDGDMIRFSSHVSNNRILNGRFKAVLEKGLDIAGRHYSFLGFSHSSLRAQSCWFVAPFQGPRGKSVTATSIIEDLGDFSEIRSPAKCAARIGQAFTDTPIAVPLAQSANFHKIPDIERGGRVFSDGVGTMSTSVMHQIWDHLPRRRARDQPTCYQIRWRGAKGMISLDTRLPGHTLCIRPSMEKFKGTLIRDIEICGASYRPLPMYLSRQLIKILEDLGVGERFFTKLQEKEVDRLRSITKSPFNTIPYLKSKGIGEAIDLPWLIAKLYDMKIDFREDIFLRDIVEMGVLMDLRLLKYKARIPVDEGYHLHGIMDETGILKEGEVFCIFTRNGVPHVLQANQVVISRAPALHPGDIQTAKAVKVPANSPLMSLKNCICFSQKGSRDLPSQLSGGDLDGDLYYVMWDHDAIPKRTLTAADYPRLPPLDIGRPVIRKDMTDFFIKFMETDQLGRICSNHEILADQSQSGTLDPNCILLAELASTAVDFSKTGIPPRMERMPRASPWRPDFMAPGPHVNVSKKGQVMFHDPQIMEEVEEEDEDLAADLPKHRFYESDKILGKLFRNIDERTIFNQIKDNSSAYDSISNTSAMSKVWSYVEFQTQGFQWQHHIDEARDIREEYESSLLNIVAEYSDHPRRPITELEVMVGNILGKAGFQTHRQRDMSVTMKERFNALVDDIVQWIQQGEAMERSVACLKVALEPNSYRRGVMGTREYEAPMSFRYLAATVCLKELGEVW